MSSLDAAAYLDHLRRNGTRIADLPPTCLLALHPAARTRRRGDRSRHAAPFAAVDIDKATSIATVVPMGPGAAVAGVTMDLLATLGVRRVVAVGVAAAVGDRAGLGSRVVIAEATGATDVCDAYGGAPVAADPVVLATALAAEAVTSLTTNTPFRFDADGCQTTSDVVEMEAAALFSVAAATGVRCDVTAIVSDAHLGSGWTAAAAEAVTTAVRSLSSEVAALLAQEVTTWR